MLVRAWIFLLKRGRLSDCFRNQEKQQQPLSRFLREAYLERTLGSPVATFCLENGMVLASGSRYKGVCVSVWVSRNREKKQPPSWRWFFLEAYLERVLGSPPEKYRLEAGFEWLSCMQIRDRGSHPGKDLLDNRYPRRRMVRIGLRGLALDPRNQKKQQQPPNHPPLPRAWGEGRRTRKGSFPEKRPQPPLRARARNMILFLLLFFYYYYYFLYTSPRFSEDPPIVFGGRSPWFYGGGPPDF